MNMNIIETVVEVSRSRSFQDAADALNYTPAVVSKHVARAEEELGVKLFFRGNKASAVSLTPECEHIIDEMVRIQDSWKRLENKLEHLQSGKAGASIRLGVGQRTWNCREDEIIADFIRQNPDITVDLTHAYTADMLNAMAQGRLDGVFLTVQGWGSTEELLQDYAAKYECGFFRVMDTSEMYLAISDRHPLARKDEAELWEFRDFTIAFNSDRRALNHRQNEQPFLELSRKYGMELKRIFLPTMDASAYQIARTGDIAIPVPGNGVRFEGVKYVRLRDWNAPFTLYFATMNHSSASPALVKFRRAVELFRERNGTQN